MVDPDRDPWPSVGDVLSSACASQAHRNCNDRNESDTDWCRCWCHGDRKAA